MGQMGAPSLAQPLLPAHPPLLRRDKCGERTVYVSPDCPKAMERANGQWWVGGGWGRLRRRRRRRSGAVAGAATGWQQTPHFAIPCPSCACRGLADYHLLKQLYKGKASTLYHATCRQSGAAVALKLYSKRRLSELNWYQVEREIRLHSQLRHPNIIQLHAAFEDDTHVFMVCEFAAGGRVGWRLWMRLGRAGAVGGRMGGCLLPYPTTACRSTRLLACPPATLQAAICMRT